LNEIITITNDELKIMHMRVSIIFLNIGIERSSVLQFSDALQVDLGAR